MRMVSIGAAIAQLHAAQRHLVLHHLLHNSIDILIEIHGGHDGGERLTYHTLVVQEHNLAGVVPRHDATRYVDAEDGVGRVLDRLPVALLTLAQFPLGTDTRADVGEYAQRPQRLARCGVVARAAAHQDRHAAAILALHLDLIRVGDTLRSAPVGGFEDGVLIRREEDGLMLTK